MWGWKRTTTPVLLKASLVKLSANSMDWDNVRVFLAVARGRQFVAARNVRS
jgi:hypothetical protein